MHISRLEKTYQHFTVKYRESIFGKSTHDRVTQKPTLWLGLRSQNKLVFGLSLILRLHVGDILLTKYWETPTKISSVVMFSIQLGD